MATAMKQASIISFIKADFTAKNSCEGKVVSLTNSSTMDEIPGGYHHWDFGDGTQSTEKFPLHVFEKEGTYFIKLVLIATSGCSDSIVKPVVISPNPHAAFAATDPTGCSTHLINFQDRSTIRSGNIVGWQWQLGIRNSTAQNPEQVYRNISTGVSTYDVKLRVISDSGCTSEAIAPKFIQIFPTPVAEFSLSPKLVSVSDALITFKNNSQGADRAIWNFGDGSLSSVLNTAPHQYTSAGTFAVTLIVYNMHGCSDTLTKELIVQPEFTFYIPGSFSPNDDDINDFFSGKGEEISEYEMFIYNRLGNIMFHTTDIHTPWNGKKNNNGESVAEDVYVYTINIVDKNRKKHFYKGIVTLVR